MIIYCLMQEVTYEAAIKQSVFTFILQTYEVVTDLRTSNLQNAKASVILFINTSNKILLF